MAEEQQSEDPTDRQATDQHRSERLPADSAARPGAPRTPPRATPPRATPDRDDDPVLPDVTSDERGAGWGDEPTRRDDDWYRSERPPHHG